MDLKTLLCFVREGVEITERQDLMSPSLSNVWLEYKPEKGKKLLFCLTYREFNPFGKEEKSEESEEETEVVDQRSLTEQLARFEEFSKQVEKACQEASVFIAGDMNVDLQKWEEPNYYLKKLAEEYQSLIGNK